MAMSRTSILPIPCKGMDAGVRREGVGREGVRREGVKREGVRRGGKV